MLTKKKVLAALAIICVMVLSLFVASQLQTITCTAKSDCGSCRVVDCDDGGCASGPSGHACLCNGIITHLVACALE